MSLSAMALVLISGQMGGVSIAFPWLVPLGILFHLGAAGLARASGLGRNGPDEAVKEHHDR